MKKLFTMALIIIGVSSCSYKKSLDDKVYIQFKGESGPRMPVAHTNPNCPEIDSYKEENLKDCYAVTVCAKCVKEEDISKILKK